MKKCINGWFVFVAEPVEKLVIKIDGKEVALKEGKAFVPLDEFTLGDTIDIEVKSTSNLTGVQHLGELRYVIE